MRILLPNPFHISLLFTKTLVWFASFSYRFSYIIPSSLRRNQCRRRVRITLIEVAYGKTFSSSPETPIFHRSSRGTWERSLFSLASRQCLFVAVPSDDSEISFCLAYQARLCQRWHSGEYRGPLHFSRGEATICYRFFYQCRHMSTPPTYRFSQLSRGSASHEPLWLTQVWFVDTLIGCLAGCMSKKSYLALLQFG